MGRAMALLGGVGSWGLCHPAAPIASARAWGAKGPRQEVPQAHSRVLGGAEQALVTSVLE